VRAKLWLTVWLVPFVLLAYRHVDWPPPAPAGDYAQYLSHARAVAEGRGYSDIGYIFHPEASTIGPPAYPPGLSLTLAPIVALDGVHSPVTRILLLGSVLAFAFLAWKRLVMDLEPWQAAVGAAFTALALEVALATLVPISDPGFCALLWATVLAVDTAGGWSWRRIVLVTVLGFAAMSYRTVGVVLVPALALYGVLLWRGGGAQRRALIPVALWGVVGVIAALPYLPLLGRLDAGVDANALVSRVRLLVRHYRLALFEAQLYPFTWEIASDGYHVAATVLMMVGAVVLARRAWRSFLVVLSACYVALLAFAPVSDGRYLWPMFPVLAAATALGAQRMVGRLAGSAAVPVQRTALVSAFGAVLIGAFLVALRRPMPASLVAHPETRALFAWIDSAATHRPLRIAFHNPRVLTLETRVPAMGLVPRTGPGQLAVWVERRITHVVWQTGPMAGCLQRIANLAVEQYPERFALEYESPMFRVYQLLPGPAPRVDEYTRLRWADRAQWCPADPGEG
jgi:hypothetical protein